MNVIQIIILLFALFAFSRSVLRLKDKAISKQEFLFWTGIWILVIIIAIIPQTASYVSSIFGIDQGINLIVYLSIILIFYLIFRLYVRIEKINQNITILVRDNAKMKEKWKK